MLKDTLILFQNYLSAEKGYSLGTIKGYVRDVERLFEYHNKDNINLTSKEISKWLNYLITDKGISPRTRNRKLASIRSFYKCMKKYDEIDVNPAENIENSKIEKKSKVTYLNKRQIQSFLDAVENYPHDTNKLRDEAILKLFLYSGLRKSELVGLNINDIDFEQKTIYVRPEIAKGNKDRYIPLHNRAKKSLLKYLNIRNDDITALFVSTRGKRISVSTIYQIVKKYAAETRLKDSDKISPHVLRHSFGTLVYNNNKDLKTLQELLGHESLESTKIYLHTSNAAKNQNVNNLPNF